MSRRRRAPRKRETRDLRSQYLEVLKLALLDLGGTSTGQVIDDDTIVEVPVDHGERLNGSDWPARALTMIGRRRLDHLQEAVEQVVQDGVEGDLIEAGVWRGGAAMLMKAVLGAYGDGERKVVLADSFMGVPRPTRPAGDGGDELYRFSDYLGVPRAQVEQNFARYGLLDKRVEFVKGLFEKTMPRLAGRRWSLMRLDGDLYESIMPPLEHLYDGLSPGGFVLVDDYQNIPQARQAVTDFRERAKIAEPLHTIDQCAVYWRKGTQANGARS
jgi:macrocin-O-methyltransferase TylF-like protien